MAKIATFEELIVWQRGMDLSEGVHRATRSFQREDLFTLGTQLRRAANSIPSNVAEGFNRHSQNAYRAHVSIALGSHAEVRTQLELCRRLALIEADVLHQLVSLAKEIGRLLHGLWRSLVVGIVCYSLTLIVFLVGLPWTAAQLLTL